MTTEQPKKSVVTRQSGRGDAVYGIGMFGAWVFYFKRATTNQERVAAFFKGLFWPAFLVYDALVILDNK